ncbi:MAG TPA: P-type conjugative transfer protein TrbL [Terriglobia bacterium]|nr:P-type conjugative transfer protein TrbL [Terriglobia bacterium]
MKTVHVNWQKTAAVCAICALIFLGTAPIANAQTSPSAMLDQFRAVRMTWLTTAATYANRLFGILALIEFAWTAAILVLERTDLQGWTAALIRKMMFIGMFFALLNFGADWIPRIINSFQTIGQTASGLGSLAPTDVLVKGLNITGNLLSGAASSGWMGNFGTALSLVFAALLAFLAFLGLTVQLVVTLVESYLVVGAGFIFLGFGGSRWTAPYVERFISLAVSTGVKIMVLYLLLGAGLTLTNGWVAAARAIPGSAEPAVDALDIAASAVLLLMICWNVPKFTAGILGGTPAFTGGDAVGTVGGLAQGALLAGTAVAGGVALGAKLLAAKGGAMSVSQAAGMGAGGGAAAGASGGGGRFGGGGAAGSASGGSAPKPNISGGGGGAVVASGGSNGGGQVSPPSPSAAPSGAGSTQVSAPSSSGGEPAQANGAPASTPNGAPSGASATAAGSPAPTVPPPSGSVRTGKVGQRTTRITRGMLTTTAMVRAAQSAIPPDHAPPAAPPPLNTGGEE